MIILTYQVSGAANTCHNIFYSADQKTSFSSSVPLLDFPSFIQIKTQIKEKVERGEKIQEFQFKDDWSKLAFFETISERNGWDLLNISKMMNEGSERDRRKMLNFLSQISFEQKMSNQRIENILTKLYLLANRHPKNFTFSISAAKERLIVRRMELSFLKQNFTEALQDLGFIRDPNILERFKLLRKQYSNFENLLISASINALSITYWGVPAHIPNFTIGESQKIPIEIINKIKENGIEAAREDLRAIFYKQSNFQFAWNTVRQLYKSAMFGLTMFMAVQIFPIIEFSVASHFTTEQRLNEIQNSTFSPQRIREEQFNSWKQAFYDLEGRSPDPSKYPQDKAEWNKVKDALAQIPDEQLKVQFDN